MSATSPQAEKFYAERQTWEQSEREAKDKKIRLLTIVTSILGVCLFVAVVAIIPLLNLHDFTPITVLVDKLTGDYEVRVGKQKINLEDKANDERMVADIAKHVKARESFTRGEAEQNYRTVWNQLPEDQRPKWRHDYVELPTAWLNTLTKSDQIKVTNPSIQWLPTPPGERNYRVAQFRYDQEKYLSGRVPTTQPFIATLTFTYDPAAVPSTIEDLATNPFGFVVSNYRADPAGPAREMKQGDGRSEK